MVCRHERANERSSVRYWDVPPFRWTPRVDKSIPRLVEVAFITATLFFYCYWNRHSSKDADVSVAANDKNLWSRFYRRNGERTLFMPRKRTIMCRQFSYKVFRCVLRYIYVCICVYIYICLYIYICIYVYTYLPASLHWLLMPDTARRAIVPWNRLTNSTVWYTIGLVGIALWRFRGFIGHLNVNCSRAKECWSLQR